MISRSLTRIHLNAATRLASTSTSTSASTSITASTTTSIGNPSTTADKDATIQQHELIARRYHEQNIAVNRIERGIGENASGNAKTDLWNQPLERADLAIPRPIPRPTFNIASFRTRMKEWLTNPTEMGFEQFLKNVHSMIQLARTNQFYLPPPYPPWASLNRESISKELLNVPDLLDVTAPYPAPLSGSLRYLRKSHSVQHRKPRIEPGGTFHPLTPLSTRILPDPYTSFERPSGSSDREDVILAGSVRPLSDALRDRLKVSLGEKEGPKSKEVEGAWRQITGFSERRTGRMWIGSFPISFQIFKWDSSNAKGYASPSWGVALSGRQKEVADAKATNIATETVGSWVWKKLRYGREPKRDWIEGFKWSCLESYLRLCEAFSSGNTALVRNLSAGAYQSSLISAIRRRNDATDRYLSAQYHRLIDKGVKVYNGTIRKKATSGSSSGAAEPMRWVWKYHGPPAGTDPGGMIKIHSIRTQEVYASSEESFVEGGSALAVQVIVEVETMQSLQILPATSPIETPEKEPEPVLVREMLIMEKRLYNPTPWVVLDRCWDGWGAVPNLMSHTEDFAKAPLGGFLRDESGKKIVLKRAG